MYIFFGEEFDLEVLVKFIKRFLRMKLVYWSYIFVVMVCNVCGRLLMGFYMVCFYCGSEDVEVWSRIIGYYCLFKNWNFYRKREFWSRRYYFF